MKRKAAVAGGFYPRFKDELIETIESCFMDKEFGPGKSLEIGVEKKPRTILGGICPHAGYSYSGAAVANTMQRIASEGLPDTIIILGTQHTGYYDIALMDSGEWETPLGNIGIDGELAKAIMAESELIINDESAFFGYPHGREHNIEVQLPFIKYMSEKAGKDVKFVPIKIGSTKFKKLKDCGEAIGRAAKSQGDKSIIIIASSDMTHKSPSNYKNPESDLKAMKRADNAVINAIKSYDWKNTLERALDTTVCGPQTITTAMIACKELKATKAEILKYYNSYEKGGGNGPCDYAVGYLSAVFLK